MTKIDSRLYHGTTARLAKKHIGWALCKLKYAVDLKPGDLLSSCKGYNERIAEIYPEWTTWHMRRGAVICDYDFVTETGCSCSAIHCCSFPLETRDQIYESWKRWLPPANATQAEIDEVKKYGWGFVEYAQRLEKIKADGGHAFDEDGQPYYEFCLHDWERKIRFPERWKEDVEANFEEFIKREVFGSPFSQRMGKAYGSQLTQLYGLTEEYMRTRIASMKDGEAILDRIVFGK